MIRPRPGSTGNRLRLVHESPPRLTWLAIAFVCIATAAPASGASVAAEAAVDTSHSLAPTSDIPWNPDEVIPAREPWESVVDAPVTLLSLPFRIVGSALRAGLLRVQQDQLAPKALRWFELRTETGLALRPSSLGDRTGTGGAVAFEPPFARDLFRASLEGSTLRYGRGHVELGPRSASLGYTHDWRPQEPFFGLGMDAHRDDVSDFSVRARRAEARFEWREDEGLRRALTAWVAERRTVLRRGRDAKRPSLEEVFPALADEQFDLHQDHAIAGARVAFDARSGRPHWTSGGRAAGSVELYGHPLGGRGVLFAGNATSPAFTRVTFEAETGWSFMRDPRSVRISGRLVDTRAADPAEPLALYDLATLGGSAGLAGFEPGRFRGMDAMLARLEYVFPLSEHAELGCSYELGGVFADLWRGARLADMRASQGISLRVRNERRPLLAVGIHWSEESARMGLALGAVE